MYYGYCVRHKDFGDISCNRGYVSWEAAMEYAKSDVMYVINKCNYNGVACSERDFNIEIFIE